MVDFSKLRKSSKASLEKLTSELNKLNQPQSNNSGSDDRFWKPTVDKAGNGQAIIRFLPAPGEEEMPFVRIWDHGFQGPGGWYIEKSLTTLGEKDPVSEYNTRLWNSGVEADKEQVRKQKRRLHYVSNIYVVKDPGNPDNEGKVFLFQYGKKIFDKISDMMNPEFEGEEAVNPFDFWEGCNFKLRIRNVEGYRNYDKSEFDKSTALASDKEMEAIWKAQHSLAAFLDRSNFKSYDELKARLDKVLGLDSDGNEVKVTKPKTSTAESATPPWEDNETTTSSSTSTDEDEDLSYFRNLAKDD